jgi:hypothetical protein
MTPAERAAGERPAKIQGHHLGRLAAALNERGHRTPHGKPFTAESVRQLRRRLEREVVKARRDRRLKKRPRMENGDSSHKSLVKLMLSNNMPRAYSPQSSFLHHGEQFSLVSQAEPPVQLVQKGVSTSIRLGKVCAYDSVLTVEPNRDNPFVSFPHFHIASFRFRIISPRLRCSSPREIRKGTTVVFPRWRSQQVFDLFSRHVFPKRVVTGSVDSPPHRREPHEQSSAQQRQTGQSD